jgi:predicted ATPase
VVFFDRSPVCTLALSRYLGASPSPLLAGEIDRAVAEGGYETTAFFIRNQGFVAATAARRISIADSLRFERIHEQVYRERGFRLVEVPAGPLADRVALIRRAVGRLTDGAVYGPGGCGNEPATGGPLPQPSPQSRRAGC